MIESMVPATWLDLQNEVSKIFLECGIDSTTPKVVETIRGKVEIDVYAVDNSIKPELIYLCECKHWKSSIPQTIIHSFRTVVSDYGANWGLIISLNGYQPGALEAVKNTNIKLLNWMDFQILFEERWCKEYFQPQLRNASEPLIEYTEPINSRIFKKVALLPEIAQSRFSELRNKYESLAYISLHFYNPLFKNKIVKLPLKESKWCNKDNIPNELFEVTAYRDILKILLNHINKATEEFDEIFGGRA